jgi:predicted transcriptional regulator
MVVQSDKKKAIELRKKGFSYSEIRKLLFIPKSTISYWLKKIKLSDPQLRRLKRKRSEAAKTGSKFKKLKTQEIIERIQRLASEEIKQISKRELWLMGIMLYWKERLSHGNKSDLKKGVRFTSSDIHLIKLFLRWLKEIGQLKREEIEFDIFLSRRKRNMNRIINYWSEITGYPKESFPRIYFQSGKSEFGLLRVRVKASSMLARQISGWIKGIQKLININNVLY